MIYHGISDIGKKRSTNQDSFTVRPLPGGVLLAVVCDGMGGANGGAVASATALEVFCRKTQEYLRDVTNERGGLDRVTAGDVTALLAHAVADANFSVWQRSCDEDALSGMGTTLVAALIIGRDLYVVNVGDSRLYHLCGQQIRQITHDHSLVQHLIDTGKLTLQEAKRYPNRNVITRAVGSEINVAADIKPQTLSAQGGYILLCSDGLSNMVTTEQLLATAGGADTGALCSEQELQARAGALIALANEGGGNDNITALLIGYTA